MLFIAVFIVLGAMLAYPYTTHRALRRSLHRREQIPPSAFGAHHYSNPRKAEIATFLLQQIQQLTDVDLTGAAPSDRINADLKLDEIDSLANVELITLTEERFHIRITDEDAARIQTIGELVDLIHNAT